jgi:hypothetical protein
MAWTPTVPGLGLSVVDGKLGSEPHVIRLAPVEGPGCAAPGPCFTELPRWTFAQDVPRSASTRLCWSGEPHALRPSFPSSLGTVRRRGDQRPPRPGVSVGRRRSSGSPVSPSNSRVGRTTNSTGKAERQHHRRSVHLLAVSVDPTRMLRDKIRRPVSSDALTAHGHP